MRRIALSIWTGIVAMSFLTLAPWILGGLVDQYGLSAAQAGQILAFNLAGTIVGPLLAFATVHDTSARAWVGVAFCAMAVGHGATLLASSFGSLAILQAIAGLGAGFGLAVANVMVAETPKPERAYGWLVAGQMLFGAAWFFSTSLLPTLFKSSADVLFSVLAGMAGASLMLLRAYPRRDREVVVSSRLSFNRSLPATLLCASLLAHYVANAAVWAYLERIGIAAGFDGQQVGLALGLSLVAGIAGASLTGRVSQRVGVFGSLIIGVVAIAVATGLLMSLRHYSTYVVATCAMLAALCFAVPFYLALLAGFDRLGRWVLLGNCVIGVGLALGPAVGSFMVGGPDFDMLLEFAITVFAVSLILALAAARTGRFAHARHLSSSEDTV